MYAGTVKKQRQNISPETVRRAAAEASKREETSESCEKNGVKKSLIVVDLTQIQLYKVDYAKNNQKCLSAEETLNKARKFLGQSKYNIFTNNDEHFCIYCKTGKAAKVYYALNNMNSYLY